MKLSISRLRVNIKSLAAEAKIIRQEFRRTKFVELDNHRKNRLREEARYAQLALGFIRGIPYASIEQKTRNKPDADRLLKKVNNFLDHYSKKTIIDIRNWLA